MKVSKKNSKITATAESKKKSKITASTESKKKSKITVAAESSNNDEITDAAHKRLIEGLESINDTRCFFLLNSKHSQIRLIYCLYKIDFYLNKSNSFIQIFGNLFGIFIFYLLTLWSILCYV